MERMLGEACNGVKKKKTQVFKDFQWKWKVEGRNSLNRRPAPELKYSTTIDQTTNGLFTFDQQLPFSWKKKKSLLFFSLFVFDRDIYAVMIRISLISLIFIAFLSFVLYLVSIEALTIHDPDTQVISSIRAAMFLRLTYDQESKMADPACVFIKM